MRNPVEDRPLRNRRGRRRANTKSPYRYFWQIAAGCFALIVLILIAKVNGFPASLANQYPAVAANPTIPIRAPAPVRGSIFETTGQMMAGDVTYEALYADPLRIVDPDQLASAVAPAIGLSVYDLRTRLSVKQSSPLLILPNLTAEQTQEVRRLTRSELSVRTVSGRVYPEGKLGSTVIGISKDNRGIIGLEAGFDDILSGRTRDRAGSRGADLVLTLDRYAQWVAEAELDRAVSANRATGGAIIVLDTSTGAVLAMASWPSLDGRKPSDEAQIGANPHPAIAEAFEPGTILAPLAVLGALDDGIVAADYIYTKPSTGSLNLVSTSGDRAANIVPTSTGAENLTQVVQRGSISGGNHLLAKAGIGAYVLAMERLGFGKATGVGMPGESGGQVRTPGSPAEQGLGVGFTATALQLANAISAIANNGVLMQPFLVREIRTDDGAIARDPRIIRQAISPAAARSMREMMVATVHGPDQTAPQAAAAGYTGGGVASSPSPYIANSGAAIFAGYVPADRPRLTIFVKINRPQTSMSGPEVTGPVFRALAERLLAYYRVPTAAVLAEVRR